MAFYQFRRTQLVNTDPATLWAFISSPRNLQRITPDYMGFDITSTDLPERMYPGMIISYKVRPLLGIATDWVTEITHVQEGVFFVDEQRIGPYALWHHQHRLEPSAGGTIMLDTITYQPPSGSSVPWPIP